MVRAIFFLALLACSGAQAAQPYHWVDAQGVTHFGDRPPPGANAEPVAVDPAPAGDAQAAAARVEALRADIERRAAERATAREETAQKAAQADQISRECERARAQLTQLQSARRVVSADGTASYGNERLKLMDALRESIARHCR